MSFGIPVRNGLSIGLLASTFLSTFLPSGRRLVPSMSQNFLTDNTLDPRITFSRTTNATLVDSTGILTWAPNNQVLRSQDLSNASSWTPDDSEVLNSILPAPDGTTPSFFHRPFNTITMGTGATQTRIFQSISATIGVSYIFSIYAKAQEYDQIQLTFTTSPTVNATFSLTLGTVVSGTGASITPAGNGWYRCALVATATSTGSLQLRFSARDSVIATGNGTSGIYVWGAQLEEVTYQTLPSTYNQTVASAYYGPRFDYDPVTLASLGLLIEEQRENLLLNSNISGTNLSTQSVTVTAQSYTISFYGTGTITLSGAAIQIVTGTGAYPSRRTFTFTPTAGVLVCTVTGTVQYAQLEAGAFVTSFIPTAAVPVTRNPDDAVMTGTNFSSWYSQSEGTMVAFYDTTTAVVPTPLGAFSVSDTTTSERMQIRRNSANTNAATIVIDGGTSQYNQQVAAASGPYRAALAYANSNFSGVNNGTLATAGTSGTVPTVTQAEIGFGQSINYLNGHLSFIAYYNSRLTDAQLQALTT